MTSVVHQPGSHKSGQFAKARLSHSNQRNCASGKCLFWWDSCV